MAVKDIITKDYMNDASVFADAFNYLLYDGQQVIAPSKLHTMDTTEIGVPYGKGNTEAPVQKFRDSLKYLAAMRDETVAYLILGIESQTEIHYAMPVKNMVYDALQYAAQVEKASKSHKKALKKRVISSEEKENLKNSFKWPSSGEYLSRFCKSDHLLPVVTLTILFNPRPWDGPMCIHDMLSVKEERILSFVPNYTINLISPALMDEISMNKFKTSLREVLLYIKYSEDREKLEEILLSDTRFRCVERKAAVVINKLTNSQIKFDEKEKFIDMCLAIKEMCQENWSKGEKHGEKRGEEQGIARVNKLNSKLLAMNRFEDLKRAAEDLAYQKKLMAELFTDGK